MGLQGNCSVATAGFRGLAGKKHWLSRWFRYEDKPWELDTWYLTFLLNHDTLPTMTDEEIEDDCLDAAASVESTQVADLSAQAIRRCVRGTHRIALTPRQEAVVWETIGMLDRICSGDIDGHPRIRENLFWLLGDMSEEQGRRFQESVIPALMCGGGRVGMFDQVGASGVVKQTTSRWSGKQ